MALFLGNWPVVCLKELLHIVQLEEGCHEDYHKFQQHKKDKGHFGVAKQNFVNKVPFDEEMLISVQLFELLVAVVKGLVRLHFLFVSD
jgi:hypothetical protein